MNAIRTLTMMISRIPPALLLASIVGIAAIMSWVVSDQMERSRRAYEDETKRVSDQHNLKGTVVVAARDIPEGKSIGAEFLEEKQIPVGTIPADAISSSSMAAGRVSKYGISAGQIVSQHDLAPIGVSMGFEQRLRQGMRAVTFAVDTNSGVAGFINPESRVDVMSMVGAGGQTKVAPILSDVEVIAVGQMYHKEPGATAAVPTNSVTVAVSPDDVNKLVRGVAASKIYLSLRSQGDHTPVLTVDVTQLYPNQLAAEESERRIAFAAEPLVPPPPATLPGKEITLPSIEPGEVTPTAVIEKRNHEIEVWSASQKQLIEIPKN